MKKLTKSLKSDFFPNTKTWLHKNTTKRKKQEQDKQLEYGQERGHAEWPDVYVNKQYVTSS